MTITSNQSGGYQQKNQGGGNQNFGYKNPTPTSQATGSTSKPSGASMGRSNALRPTGKLYAMKQDEAKNADIMTGNFLVHNKVAHVLFDSGATHSFVSHEFVRQLGLEP